ncbi:MAG TPA: AsmA-like C-terminal region-containing protein [Candidatus Hydrogenedentes bacterium]|nr:AsmA-like C-terminal region-containing protein [Candidatus Hydrogenedentota bacterium]
MFALLVLTVVFVAGVLFIRYQLTAVRESLVARAENRLGGNLQLGALQVNGLRGFSVDGFQADVEVPEGPNVQVTIPKAYVYVNLIDLVYGYVNIERVVVDGAKVMLSRREGEPWFRIKEGAKPGLPEFAFRVMGKGCSLEIQRLVGETGLQLSNIDLDVARLLDSPDLSIKIAGAVNNDPQKNFVAKLRYASMQDFDLRAQCGELCAEDVNAFLPPEQQVAKQGSVTPSVHVTGDPNRTLVVSVEAPFKNLFFRDQPALLKPVSGSLNALGGYNLDTRVFTLITAKVQSEQLAGRLEGTVSFAADEPALDLHLRADQVPVMEAVDYLVKGKVSEFGQLTVDVQPPYEFGLGLQGTPKSPVFSAEASVNAGTVSFVPKDPLMPRGQLTFGMMKVSWDSKDGIPYGTFNVTDGTIDHEEIGLYAKKISGTLVLKEKMVMLDPINAELTGNAFVGRAQYDLEAQQGEFTVSGLLEEAEKTPLGDLDDFAVSGMVNATCSGKISKSSYAFDAELDLTRAQVDFDWWLRKPIGVGSTIPSFKVEFKPKKSITLEGDGAIDATQLHANFLFDYQKKKFDTKDIRFVLSPVDVPATSKCLRVPYALSGVAGKEIVIEYKRLPKQEEHNTIHVYGTLEDVVAMPEGASVPVTAKGASVDVFVNDLPHENQGMVKISAAEAHIPPLSVKWLLPLHPKDLPDDRPGKKKKAPEPEKTDTWTFVLNADSLEMPPWRGTEFSGEAFTDEQASGMRRFSAKIDGGSIEGSFSISQEDNIMEMQAKWDSIPTVYLLRHLNFPEVLEGKVKGQVHYRMDNDDPDTLKGAGLFDIEDGRFSADFLAKQFKEQLKGSTMSLPPSLEFSRFAADVELLGDTVKTKNIVLRGNGITITGDGDYIRDGDMHFSLKASITPDMAQKMPILMKSFNIDGHRLTQNNIEIAFDIKGPTFNPSGEVTGIPSIGVTLVSGAGELTSEAIKIIDAPRQILIDLIKIFGGIVGPGKTPVK